MENSILLSTKKILGIAPDYNVFDLDVITHINAALSIVSQLGVGPMGSHAIDDASDEWDDLGLPQNQLSVVRTYVFLRVRMLFDPPQTSFHIEAVTRQLQELEYRLSYFREATVPMREVRSDYDNIDPIY